MPFAVALFATAAVLLWCSVFGYLLALAVLAARRTRSQRAVEPLPEITVLVPVRNEAECLAAKLDDLRRADYPAERMRIVVADGDSDDGTPALVEAAAREDPRITLLRVPGARHKLDQVRAALATIDTPIVVATDADAALEPACIRRLVDLLAADPTTAVVGAWVNPATPLLEERLYWLLLNRLWWLEGEALGAAVVSGVCFAVRRTAIDLTPAVGSDDVAIAYAAAAAGARVRLCSAAQVTELRVPRTPRELLHFRVRRGRNYLAAVLRPPRGGRFSSGWRCATAVRHFHFRVTPLAAPALAVVALMLAFTPHWPVALIAASAFAIPLAALAAGTRGLLAARLWRLAVAGSRLLGLTWLALVALLRPPTPLQGK
jgi:cellulose synthase/poly-beta-1,6-N-acetylglucosamine synthase-like glycosyltransferase